MPEPSQKPVGDTTSDLPIDPDATTASTPDDTQALPARPANLDSTLDGATTGKSFREDDAALHPRRGKYAVVRLHAEGGLGKVSVALDERIGRRVALKEIRADRHSEGAERRFLNEAEITGQLEHPGIVPVYTMDEDEQGQPFYVMRFIEGITLHEAIDRYRSSPDAAAFSELITRFLDVCQALAYAHSKKIIHRDLKPANVMLGDYGETLVLDWGLAKRLDGSQEETLTSGADDGPPQVSWATMDGTVLGTPSYLAPEQARGEIATMNECCDVFGLGGILCAIITGDPPFQGESVQELKRKAQQGDLSATFQRLDRCDCDAELIAIAKHCLAPNPADRPTDAGAVAASVSAYLASVQDRLKQAELDRVAAQTKAAEEAKRRRVTVGLCLAVVGFLLALAVGVSNFRQQQRQFVADLASAWDGTEERIAESYQYTLDPFQMRKTLEMGDAHWQRADERLQGHTTVSSQLLQRHDATGRKLREANSDLDVLEALDLFEQNSTRVDAKNSRYDNAGAVDALFVDLKSYFKGVAEGEFASFVNGRPDVMQDRLRDILYLGLSEAALIRHAEPMKWFRSIIDQVDADPWRHEVVDAMVVSDRDALAQLSQKADMDGHAPMFLASYADWLPNEEPSRRESFLRNLQSRYPSYFWVNHGLARLHEERLPDFQTPLPSDRKNDAREAVRFFTAATVARPRNAGICVNLGLVLERLGRVDEAIVCYQRAVDLRPDYFAGYENLALALRDRGDIELAISALTEAIRLKPSPGRCATLGELMFANGRDDDAIASYRKGVALEADNSVAHLQLASALERLDRLDEAAESYRQGLALDPNSHPGHYNFGNLQSRREDFPSAAKNFQRAIELRPDDTNSWIGFALVQLRGGHPGEGIDALKHAIQLQSDDPLAWTNLGYAYLSIADHARSEHAYRQAIAADPHDPRSMVFLGEVLKRQGRVRDALAEYQRADAVQDANLALPLQEWIRDTEKIVKLCNKLPLSTTEIEEASRDNVEHLLLTAWQGFHDRQWQSAAILLHEVSQRQDDLIADHLTNVRTMAAQVLIMATMQNGIDTNEANANRQQAFQWMTADFDAWMSADLSPQHAVRVRETLTAWQENPNFAAVRDDEALKSLAEQPGRDWRRFWQQVSEALSQQ